MVLEFPISLFAYVPACFSQRAALCGAQTKVGHSPPFRGHLPLSRPQTYK